MDRPEGEGLGRKLSRAESGLREAIQVGLQVNAEYPNPDNRPWQRELKAVEKALNEGDTETLRRYAQGQIAPDFPYRSSVESYIRALDS